MSTVRHSYIFVFLTMLFVSGCEKDKPTSTTDSDNFVYLQSSSQHYNYYCANKDAEVIDTIRVLLETNLKRICTLYDYTIDDTTDVFIYPDFKTFHASVVWGTDDIPPDLVGQCVNAKEIKFISPLNAEPINSYSEILIVAVHESIHAINFHVFDPLTGLSFPPTWLFEGFATFEANQFPNRAIIRQRINSGELPLIEQYNDYYFFTDNYGYHFSYTIFEFLINQYGYNKVSMLLRHPSRIAEALGTNITMDTLNAGWHQFMVSNYSS